MLTLLTQLTVDGDILIDNEIWMAIVALNITIVGLTSLADKRSVIGIDYGKYLLNKYKFFNRVSMYNALIIFASINIASVLVLWSYTGLVRDVFYILLVLSFLFAMYYFFGYILREHPAVRRKIIEDEILKLYNNNDVEANFEADKIIGLRGGREPKKISTDVLEYFNSQNSETSFALKEVFGPDSMLYKVGGTQADYRIPDTSFNNISWEFFQMFRYIDIQDKVAIEILNIFDVGGKEQEFGIQTLRFNNVARMMGQVNKIGHSSGLYNYKFIEYFSKFIYEAIPLGNDYPDYAVEHKDKRKSLEEYFFTQLSIYVFRTLTDYPTETFYRSSLKVLNTLLNDTSTRGVISMQQRFHIVRDAYNNQLYGPKALQLLIDLVENLVDKKGVIENVIFDFGAVLVQWNQHFLYDKYFENSEEGLLSQVQAKSKANYFLNNICTPEWAARIDKGESFDCCVEELVLRHPKWKSAIEAYRSRWFDMLPSEIEGMADVVNSFKKNGFKVYGLSNWSAETFDEALKRFPVLNEIPERVISGEVGMIKPNKDIYYCLFNKYKIDPHTSLFIDDNLENIKTAKELGMYTIHFTTVEELMRNDLIQSLLCPKNNTPAC